jgi:hypothetical protein
MVISNLTIKKELDKLANKLGQGDAAHLGGSITGLIGPDGGSAVPVAKTEGSWRVSTASAVGGTGFLSQL